MTRRNLASKTGLAAIAIAVAAMGISDIAAAQNRPEDRPYDRGGQRGGGEGRGPGGGQPAPERSAPPQAAPQGRPSGLNSGGGAPGGGQAGRNEGPRRSDGPNNGGGRPGGPGNGGGNGQGRPGGSAPQGGWNNRPGGPQLARPGYNGNQRWDRNQWRGDRRYNWQDFRARNRSVFRAQPYYAPYRHYSYRRFGIGSVIGSLFFGSQYWIDDPYSYRLPEVYGPYRWVRYYDDVLLVNIYTGEVVDVIYDFFY